MPDAARPQGPAHRRRRNCSANTAGRAWSNRPRPRTRRWRTRGRRGKWSRAERSPRSGGVRTRERHPRGRPAQGQGRRTRRPEAASLAQRSRPGAVSSRRPPERQNPRMRSRRRLWQALQPIPAGHDRPPRQQLPLAKQTGSKFVSSSKNETTSAADGFYGGSASDDSVMRARGFPGVCKDEQGRGTPGQDCR